MSRAPSPTRPTSAGADGAAEPALVGRETLARWVPELEGPVAITGGTGFVGSHLVDALCASSIRPRILVRDPRRPRWIGGRDLVAVEGDLGERAALGRLVEGARVVCHLAGLVRSDRAAAFDEVNRQGTANLVAAIAERAPDARLVFVSSLSAVGPAPGPGGVGPEAEPHPISAYGRSKLAAEAEVRRLGSRQWWCVLRPPAVYGPRDTDVLELFKMAARGWLVAPAGERWVSVAYVADVVRAILAAAASGEAGRCYHLGEPSPRRLDELLRELAAAGGRRARLVRVPALLIRAAGLGGTLSRGLGLPAALTRDKARELVARHWSARTRDSLAALGIERTTLFAEGAETSWAWYRAHGWVRP